MKLSVFCSEQNKEHLPFLRLALDEFFIEYQSQIIKTGDSLNDMVEPLKQMIDSTPFSLVIPDADAFESQWLSFVLAYADLNKENILILSNDAKLPRWLERFPLATTLDELIEIIKSKLDGWDKQLMKKLAESTLEDRMKEHTHQDFFHAVEEGDRFMTGVFLDAGFEVNKLSADSVSLLGVSARHGYLPIAQILLEAGGDINRISLDRNNTPLMDAASEGHLEMVQFFLEHGAELEIKSKSGQTALILATGNGHHDCAEVLIKAGADCDVTDSMGLSARKYAQLYHIAPLLELMAETAL